MRRSVSSDRSHSYLLSSNHAPPIRNQPEEEEEEEKQPELDSLDGLVIKIMYLGLFWMVMVGLAILARVKASNTIYPENLVPPKVSRAARARRGLPVNDKPEVPDYMRYGVPRDTLSRFGSYPNSIGISEDDRESFHNIMNFPLVWTDSPQGKQKKPNLQILDLTRDSPDRMLPLSAPPQTGIEIAKGTVERWIKGTLDQSLLDPVAVGRYDEIRENYYTIEGYNRTLLSLGIELGGHVGTRVFAFEDGVIVKKGRRPNEPMGHFVVLEHTIAGKGKLWALYGHLDERSIRNLYYGKYLKKGRMVGRLSSEGPLGPHLFFQLSLVKPSSKKEWPFAVPTHKRPKSLRDHPDPRLVLGEVY